MPLVYDRDTLLSLIASIENKHVDSSLKIGYFLKNSPESLPVGEGLELLIQSKNRETVGTRRWFALQSVIAFAACYVPTVPPRIGIEAYNESFEATSLVQKADATYYYQQLLRTFLIAVPGRFEEMQMSTDPALQKAVKNAWINYVKYTNGSNNLSFDLWKDAFGAAKVSDAVAKEAKVVLETPSVPKSYHLYTTAGVAIGIDQPEKAVSLFLKAREFLPETNLVEVNRFFETLTIYRFRSKDFKGALSDQLERIAMTGEGVDMLLLCQVNLQDTRAVSQTLGRLSQAGISDKKLLALVEKLLDLEGKDEKGELASSTASSIVSQSLKEPRPLEFDLSLRALWCQWLFSAKRHPEAMEIIESADFTTQSLSTRVEILRGKLKLMLSQLNEPKEKSQIFK